MDSLEILCILKKFGVGHRKLDDDLFVSDHPPPRLGIYDEDEENQCGTVAFLTMTGKHPRQHFFTRESSTNWIDIYKRSDIGELGVKEFNQGITTQCTVPGCNFTADTIQQYENHYNSAHRYSCSQCKKVLPSPHLLDLHIQEQHDSFFAVMAVKKPSYSCYIEECKEKFMNAEDRLDHCVKIHKMPKDFRFHYKPKQKSKKKNIHSIMETDAHKEQKFNFTNSRQKGFIYTGKKFTKEQDSSSSVSVDMDAIMTDLKENLPQS